MRLLILSGCFYSLTESGWSTALTESGVDLRIVQTLMRHQSLATTEIYTRVSDKRRAAAIDRVDPFALAQMDAAA